MNSSSAVTTPSTPPPKESRPFDFLIYGATGFTGKKVASYLQQCHPDLKVALAGRNLTKLQQVATELGYSPQNNNVLVASTDNPQQLVDTFSQSRIVLACAGPYRHVGKEIVQAAIQSQTDYLDLCGEPQFFDDMLVQFDEEAQKAQTLVVSACAFDCVPADLSAAMVAREVRRRYNHNVVSGIEIVHTFENIACGNPTTFHAAVDGFHASTNGELKTSRKLVKEKYNVILPSRPTEWPNVPKSVGNSPMYHSRTNTHLLKFMGADAACIIASDRYLRIRDATTQYAQIPPPKLSVTFGLINKSSAYKVLAYGAIFSTLAKFEYGCKLLHDNPSLFSGGFFREGGPTDEELVQASFKTYSTAYGSTSDECVYGVCKGLEPGYVATPRMIVALGLTVLRYRHKLKFEGGVTLPGALFGDCDEAYDQLRKEGITFDIVDENGSICSENDSMA